jgi:hypothetical protein
MQVQQLFELNELALETHVREYHWAFLTGKCEGSLEVHVVLLHEVCNHHRGTA